MKKLTIACAGLALVAALFVLARDIEDDVSAAQVMAQQMRQANDQILADLDHATAVRAATAPDLPQTFATALCDRDAETLARIDLRHTVEELEAALASAPTCTGERYLGALDAGGGTTTYLFVLSYHDAPSPEMWWAVTFDADWALVDVE